MDKKFLAESAQKSAEHYNFLIWNVFSISVALSLYILYIIWPCKLNIGIMHFCMSILGFLVLFYSTLAIESFGQKKSFMYNKFNKQLSDFRNIKNLPYFKLEWIAELILLSVFLLYIYLFGFIWINNSLETFGKQIIFLAPLMFFVSIIILIIVLLNWMLRPKGDNGNFLEKIRKFFLGNWLKSYNYGFSKGKPHGNYDGK